MNIRKYLLAGILAASILPLSAQEQQESKEEFKSHWFVQGQFGGAHTVGEAKFKRLNSPAAALNIGYQISPLLGVRVGGSGWQAKGGWVDPRQNYKYKYLQGNIDALLDLSALFCKFDAHRVFNVYAFVGGAYNHAYDNGATELTLLGNHKLEYLWTGSKNTFGGRGGLGANIRLSKHIALNIEANGNMLSDKFNSKKADNPDWQLNALVGLTIKLGKGYKTSEPAYVAPEPVAEPEPEVKPEPKPQPKPQPQPKPEPVVVQKASQRADIFFDLGKSEIKSVETAKVNDLILFMKKNPETKVTLTGYADAGTGNKTVNMKISEKRADAVKAALIKGGIDESRITTDYKGDSVQPFRENDLNRVTIGIAE